LEKEKQAEKEKEQKKEEKKTDRPRQVGLLKLILPSPDRNYDELYLYSHAEKIFEFLAG